MFDYLIVGAGLFGAVVARELLDAGKSVLVLEKRGHIGGNCYTESVDGILMSRYGGHVFHTKSRRIWDYVSRFTEWQQYEHRVKVCYKGKIYSFPPNRMTVQQMGLPFWKDTTREIRRRFFEGYTAKQWGRPIEEVPAYVLRRIPVRDNWDDRYFDDPYQALPLEGYTPMIERMLDGATVALGTDYLQSVDSWRSKARQVIYTGPLDELYGCDAGRLEYRSLRFEHYCHTRPDFQGAATINYTDIKTPYTRRMEWKHFWRVTSPRTIVTTEYPQDYTGENEPYYPVGDEKNRKLFDRYYRMASDDGYITGGRLGSYQYLNMDQAVGAALTTAGRLLNG